MLPLELTKERSLTQTPSPYVYNFPPSHTEYATEYFGAFKQGLLQKVVLPIRKRVSEGRGLSHLEQTSEVDYKYIKLKGKNIGNCSGFYITDMECEGRIGTRQLERRPFNPNLFAEFPGPEKSAHPSLQ